MVKMFWSVIALLTMHAVAAGAQDKLGMWGFVNVRYDTRSSASIYTGYGWHAVFAIGGVLHNPRTGYAELVGGVGAVVRTGAAEHWLAFATAGAGARSFAQVFWLPTLRTGAVTTRANVKLTVPYGGRSARKLSISPLSAIRPLAGRLAGGIAMEMGSVQHGRTRFAAGLELRCRLPGAVLGVDALRDVRGNGAQLRLFFNSAF